MPCLFVLLRGTITLGFRFKLVSLLVCKFGKNFWVSFRQLIANSNFWLFWLETIMPQLTWYDFKLLVAKFSRAWKKQGFCFSAEPENIIVFPACMSRSLRYNNYCAQSTPYAVTRFQPPRSAPSLLHTRMQQLNSHSWGSAHQVVFLCMVTETVGGEHCNILISPSALSSLLADKRAEGGGKATVVWRYFENISKNAKTVRTFAVWMCYSKSCFGISLELKQLATFQLPVSSVLTSYPYSAYMSLWGVSAPALKTNSFSFPAHKISLSWYSKPKATVWLSL